MAKKPVELWLEALRSGEYKQCTQYLNLNRTYCCLGVACEVYQKEVGDLHVEENATHLECDSYHPFEKGTPFFEYDSKGGSLPDKVMSWLGIKDQNGKFYPAEDDYNSKSLVSVNDNGKTFLEIANLIESNPRGLFDPESESWKLLQNLQSVVG